MHTKKNLLKPILTVGLVLGWVHSAVAADPLPSWNDTAPKKAIIAFVEKVTREGSPDFVPALPNASPHSATRNGWTVVSMKDDWKTIFSK